MFRIHKSGIKGKGYPFTVPVSQGGTGAKTDKKAVENLGGIYIGNANTAGGPVMLDERKFIDAKLLPSISLLRVTLAGPLKAKPESVVSYQITNYDSFRTYLLSSPDGSISRLDDFITFKTGRKLGNQSFTINGNKFTITVEDPASTNIPVKPTITYPIAGSNSVPTNAVFKVGPFAMQSGVGIHAVTEWQTSVGINFTSAIETFQVTPQNSTDLTIWNPQALINGQQIFVRCRFKDESKGFGPWSDPVAFSCYSSVYAVNQAAKLTNLLTENGARIGHAVDMTDDGTRCVVSVPRYGNDTGAVVVYKLTNNDFLPEQALHPSDPEEAIFFGADVKFSGDGLTLVVSASNSVTSKKGALYVYKYRGGQWEFITKLVSTDNVSLGNFGEFVSVNRDGTYILAGAPYYNGAKTSQGYAAVFSLANDVWSASQMLQTTGLNADAFFGFSGVLNADGTRAYIGAPGQGTKGLVYVYKRVGSVWTFEKNIQDTEVSDGAFFGNCVELSNDSKVLAVSSRYDSSTASRLGSASIFRDGGSGLAKVFRVSPPQAFVGAEFGSSLRLSGNGKMLVAGYQVDQMNRGSFYAVKIDGVNPSFSNTVKALDGVKGDFFGYAVGSNNTGSKLIISAPFATLLGATLGSGYIFGAA